MTRSTASNQWQDPASSLPRGQTTLRVMAARVPEHPGLPQDTPQQTGTERVLSGATRQQTTRATHPRG